MFFFVEEDGKGEVCPRYGSGAFSPRKVLVCLYPSTSIRQCLLVGKSFLNAIILNCNWENFRAGVELDCLGENPAHAYRVVSMY